MTADISITGMTPQYAADAAALETERFSDPWSTDSILSELNEPQSIALAAVDTADGKFVGHIFGRREGDSAYIERIAVAAEHEGQGIASALLECFSDAAGCELVLDVRVSNERAVRFYERHGFTRLALRRRLYSSPAEDGLTYGRPQLSKRN